MSTRAAETSKSSGRLLELTISSALTALSIVLHLFKFPYPPAAFLKFDGVGIPLAVLALYSLRASIAVQPVVFVGLQLMGADFIGASMKVVAELSTFIPLTLSYRLLCLKKGGGRVCPLPVVLGIVSRVVAMSILNYVVTPYWITLTYGWTYERAYHMAITLIPHIAIFNTIAAIYIGFLAMGVFKVVSRTLGI